MLIITRTDRDNPGVDRIVEIKDSGAIATGEITMIISSKTFHDRKCYKEVLNKLSDAKRTSAIK